MRSNILMFAGGIATATLLQFATHVDWRTVTSEARAGEAPSLQRQDRDPDETDQAAADTDGYQHSRDRRARGRHAMESARIDREGLRDSHRYESEEEDARMDRDDRPARAM